MQDMPEESPWRAKSETAFAVSSIIAAVTHAAGEGYYHLRWGQPFSALFPDVVAINLLRTAGLRSLTIGPRSAIGLLAAGWGFLTCLAYRAAFERREFAIHATRTANGEPPLIEDVLSMLLLACTIAFAWALYLAWRASSRQIAR